MVYCSIQEAYGVDFKTRSNYNTPPVEPATFASPKDPYLTGQEDNKEIPSNYDPNDIINRFKDLEHKIETFVASPSDLKNQTQITVKGTKHRLENILHYVLMALFAGLVVEGFN